MMRIPAFGLGPVAVVWLLLPLLVRAAGVPAIHFANGYILTNGRVAPEPPPEFSLRDDTSEGTYRIVQFAGPVRHEWRERLSALGADAVAYLPQHAAVVATRVASDRLREEKSVIGVSRFGPVFKLASELLDSDTAAALLVMPFPGHDVDSLARRIEDAGFRVAAPAGRVIGLTGDRRVQAAVAQFDAVAWIQPRRAARVSNVDVQWVLQGGWQPVAPPESAGRRLWDLGLRGQGTVIGVVDVGVNTQHEAFRDPLVSIRDAGIYLQHRKIVAYKLYGRAAFDIASLWGYHGNHIASTAAGSDAPFGNRSRLDGIAPEARVCFVSVYNQSGTNVAEYDLTALLDTVYLGRGLGRRVSQSSMSWGWTNGGARYEIPEATADAACWRYPDFLAIWAAGNNFYFVESPGSAKSVLAVGGTGNGIGADTVFIPGSHGPMRDGRIKPEVVAPAIDVWSAGGPGETTYSPAGGTSLAAPAVNGACALMRQYLNEGWYPTGRPDPGHRLLPSSALLRALAVAGADANVRVNGQPRAVPDSVIGWGRPDLDSVLYFEGDERGLLLWDERTGVATGDTREHLVNVTGRIPLRIVLCWTDTAAMPNAETSLVNNLDLEVLGADQSYRGNKLTDGQSVPHPFGWDSVNTIECFRWNNPAPGIWRIRVHARNVFTARQPYAVVVTGAINDDAVGEERPVGCPPALAPVPSPVKGRLNLTFSLPTAGPAALAVFDCTGRPVCILARGSLTPGQHARAWDLTDDRGERLAPGVYFLRLRAGNREVTRKLVVAD